MITEWFEHPCLRVASVQRFSTVPTLHKESVAEHSFFVALLAWQISEHVPEADTYVVLKIAIAHDLDEAFSGDMPHPFKYSDPKLKEILEQSCQGQMCETLWAYPSLLNSWSAGKQYTLESQVVKFADLLSCLLFAYRERKLGSSIFADEILNAGRKHFQLENWDCRLHVLCAELLEFAERNYT